MTPADQILLLKVLLCASILLNIMAISEYGNFRKVMFAHIKKTSASYKEITDDYDKALTNAKRTIDALTNQLTKGGQ